MLPVFGRLLNFKLSPVEFFCLACRMQFYLHLTLPGCMPTRLNLIANSTRKMRVWTWRPSERKNTVWWPWHWYSLRASSGSRVLSPPSPHPPLLFPWKPRGSLLAGYALIGCWKMAYLHEWLLKKSYRICSINRRGRLLNFWTLRVGAYSRWALIKFSPFSASEVYLFCNKTINANNKTRRIVTKQRFCKLLWRKLPSSGKSLIRIYTLKWVGLGWALIWVWLGGGGGRRLFEAGRLLTFFCL